MQGVAGGRRTGTVQREIETREGPVFADGAEQGAQRALHPSAPAHVHQRPARRVQQPFLPQVSGGGAATGLGFGENRGTQGFPRQQGFQAIAALGIEVAVPRGGFESVGRQRGAGPGGIESDAPQDRVDGSDEGGIEDPVGNGAVQFRQGR